MNQNYNDVIIQVSELLFTAIIEREDNLSGCVKHLDRKIAGLLRLIGLQLVSRLLGWLCDSVTTAVANSRNLSVHRRKPIKYFTLYGQVVIESPYLWNGQSKMGARPVKDLLGIQNGGRSIGLEEALVDFGIEQSYGKAGERFCQHYGWNIDRYRIRRAVVKNANQATKYVEQRLDVATESSSESEISATKSDPILLELDGCHIRTGRLEETDATPTQVPPKLTEARQLPKRKRSTEWREVRVGFARPLCHKEQRTFVARMSKYPEIVSLLFRAAKHIGMSPGSQVIAVADGGKGLREELELQFPGLQFILDRPHLKKHLYESAEAIGLSGNEKSKWVLEKITQIDKGQVKKVITELKAYRKRGQARLANLANYLQRFSDCVEYNRFIELGFPVGSGEIESAHRYIPQNRLKIPGATWHPDSINPLLALRLVRVNGWWDDFWEKKAEKTKIGALGYSSVF